MTEKWVADAIRTEVRDMEQAAYQLQQDFKYPVDAHGNVFLIDYTHPDLVPTLVHHLIKAGWRKDPDKALIKPRKVVGSAFEDLVAWVPMDQPDEPIHASRPEPPKAEGWSVTPTVNDVYEKRPE